MKTTPRYTSQQLADQIQKHIEELAAATDASRLSAEMLNYLEVCSRFHQYSFHNIWLIFMAFPQATRIAGFQGWLKLRRFVRKGEQGIPILAPILIKEQVEKNETKSSLRGFKVVYLFDISQTDGEPLPAPPNWNSCEKNEQLTNRLIAFAHERGITVTEKVLAGEIQGVSRGGSIDLSPEAGTSTLIHEIAHELLHGQMGELLLSREAKELEAEAVAYVVGRHFELNVSTSANYIALWKGNKAKIFGQLDRIRKVASEIISNFDLGEL